MVRSSWVGPTPPLVKRWSTVGRSSRTAVAITSISSGTTRMRVRRTPSWKSSPESQRALVSSTLPVRISFPMTRIAAVDSPRSTADHDSGYHGRRRGTPMLNPKLKAWFTEYADYHRHPTNRLTHKIAIPLIVFQVIAMLDWVHLANVPGLEGGLTLAM